MNTGLRQVGPAFDQAWRYAYGRLAHELSPLLVYHSAAHTRDDVVPAAEHLALTIGVAEDSLLLLQTAAWFHDLGFIRQRTDHETASILIARHALPRFGFASEHVALVEQLITATRLPQRPQTLLQQILADADLDSLGRDDFLATSLALRDELAAFGVTNTLGDWYAQQLRFLQTHRYYTDAARALRDAGKQCNIELLQTLAQLSPT